MRRRLSIWLLVLVSPAALLATGSMSALAQDRQQTPTDLWNEYPLDETAPESDPAPPGDQTSPGEQTSPGGRPQERTSGGDDGGGSSPLPLVALAMVVLGGAGLLMWRLTARRSQRPAPTPAAGPEPTRPGPKPALKPGVAATKPSAPAPKPAVASEPIPAAVAAKPEPATATDRPEKRSRPQPKQPTAPTRVPSLTPQPASSAAAKPATAETPRPAPAEAPQPTPLKLVPAVDEAGPQTRQGPDRQREVPPANGAGAKQSSPAAEPPPAQPVPAPPVEPAPAEAAPKAVGYTTVPDSDEAAGTRLRDEARQIEEACDRLGIELSKLVRDLEPTSGPDLRRPGLTYALESLEAGEFECLVVPRLDRLTRSAANLGALIKLLDERDARLVVVDIDLDTSTEEGRLAADALVKVGGLERRRLEQRTRKGLEAARDRRRSSGRPAVADRPSLKQRIADMRASGMTLQAIADTLNDEGIPTVRGGAEWRPSSVQAAAGYKRPNRRKNASGGDTSKKR